MSDKNDKRNKYYEHIAVANIKSLYSYRILLLLLAEEYTQAQLSELLKLQKQNTAKYVKELLDLNLIEVTRVEGRNKFFRAITDMKKLSAVIPGQIKI